MWKLQVKLKTGMSRVLLWVWDGSKSTLLQLVNLLQVYEIKDCYTQVSVQRKCFSLRVLPAFKEQLATNSLSLWQCPIKGKFVAFEKSTFQKKLKAYFDIFNNVFLSADIWGKNIFFAVYVNRFLVLQALMKIVFLCIKCLTIQTISGSYIQISWIQ